MGSIDDRVNVGVGVIVRDSEGRVLLGKRINDKHGKGTYSFPGGKPDPGEDPAFAALRELYEETGLVGYGLESYDTWTYDRFEDWGVHYVTLYFQVYADGEPRNCEPEKCEGWDWYDVDELPQPLFSGVAKALGRD